MKFSQLSSITRGDVIQLYNDGPVSTLVTDSRKALADSGALFFAIKGERHDGHKHLKEVYETGIRQFIVEQQVAASSLPNANVLVVTSSIGALQDIASHHRESYTFPVIGITGSNGKTIIKEWLYQLLLRDFAIVKNPGSYNSQIGVPLSVWQMQPHHRLGIFEAGISRMGEMEKLEKIIRPTLGIFTNIGSAHDDGFSGKEEKIREKLKLFQHAALLVYCYDHHEIDKAIKQSNIHPLSWGFTDGANIHVSRQGNKYRITTKDDAFDLVLPFTDHASIENCFHCIALMMHLGIPVHEIQSRITTLQSVPMRLELKEGVNHCQIIDDTYNNDLAGLQVSLEFLAHQHQKPRKKLILSDILQSGTDDATLVKRIAELVEKNSLHAFTGIGPALLAHSHLFKLPSEFYPDTESFLSSFDSERYNDEVILVKGARPFQFEKIVHRLQRKVHGTIMEIDLGALVYNLNYIRSKIKPQTKIMVMVKALAYGSGSIEVANVLQYHKIDYLGVAYADEGVELRRNNITIPVMVMNPSDESFDLMRKYNLEPEIYSFGIFKSYIRYLNGQPGVIHLKLDTGMHRLGFDESDLEELIQLLASNPAIKVASIFSHLAGADEHINDNFSYEQARRFQDMSEKIIASLSYKPIRHILNSPGILRLPDLQLDMVRLGIGLYGIDPTNSGFPLKPVATLKTVISQIKKIEPGDTIGYGRKGKAERPMKLATIAIGYADGFSRAFSRGVGEVLVKGKRAKVVGNVCMDMTMVDITGIDAEEGDDVIIFGNELPIQEVAGKIDTIPYEILTNTSERVKRIFVAESI